MKTPSAILFDFNGTFFADSPLHQKSWERFFARKGFAAPITEGRQVMRFSGCPGRKIMQVYFGADAPLSEADAITLNEEKELLYRELCEELPNLQLADGAAEFLTELRDRGFPNTIATGSEITNLRYYFEGRLQLSRWFRWEDIVYDDGSFPGKPAPDIYLLAAARLGVDPAECAVFEDGRAGMQAARNAGAGLVVAVDPNGQAEQYVTEGLADLAIRDFRGIKDLLFGGTIP